MPTPKVIGIDLGTTYCSVGVFLPGTGQVKVIADENGHNSIPSIVSFTDRDVYVGYDGLELADANPQNTIYDAKRFIGKIFTSEELKSESSRYPFKIFNNDGSAEFSVTTNETFRVTPEHIGSQLLLKLKKMAEDHLGVPISKAVISVPAEFDERQRNATVKAANLAGLEILRVINEPTAAAMAYGLHKADVFNVLVVDLGGGTLDVSLLNKQGGMFLTRAMAGNNKLGGQDFNQRLMQHLYDQLNQVYGSLPSRKEEIHRLRQAVEAVLKEGHLHEEEVDEIVLVGGSTRIPKIREVIRDFFGKEPNTSVDPDLAVVMGVAIQAGIVGGSWPLQVSAIEIPNKHLRKTNFN
uniref:Heat shock 70 kDa protein 13 n=1 Tax=Chrysolophus pictus TaxID=9089 RepID=A0A8C3L2T2_CHRPC